MYKISEFWCNRAVKGKRKNMAKRKTKKDVSIEKAKLESKAQVNGVVDEGPKIFDYIRKQNFPYETTSLEEYRKILKSMNFEQLRSHAIAVAQILPNITERLRLEDKLEREFLRKLGLYMIQCSPNSIPKTGLSKEAEDNIKNILKR